MSDVPPDSLDFPAVQWFGTRGGLHAIAGENQPKAESLGGQYTKAHPGHAINLEQKLDRETYDRWYNLASLPAFNENLSRHNVIVQAYQSRHQRQK